MTRLCSPVAAPFYTPTSSLCVFCFLHILSTLVIICLFDYDHPSGCEVVSHCGFDSHLYHWVIRVLQILWLLNQMGDLQNFLPILWVVLCGWGGEAGCLSTFLIMSFEAQRFKFWGHPAYLFLFCHFITCVDLCNYYHRQKYFSPKSSSPCCPVLPA